MIRGRRAGGLVFAAAAAFAMVGLSAVPATATVSLTVKVSGGGRFTATASKTVLSDAADGVGVTCTTHGLTHASVASGKVANGTRSGAVPVKVTNVAKLSFGHCSGPLGAVKIAVSSLPYSLSIDSKTTSTGKSDAIVGGINVAVSMAGCSFTVTGSSPGYYSNTKHELVMTKTSKLPTRPYVSAQLTISNVVGCASVINNGDHATYVTAYVVNRRVIFKSR